MKKKTNKTDLFECTEKLKGLLEEYNCKIEFDNELWTVIIYDVDTKVFEYIPNPE